VAVDDAYISAEDFRARISKTIVADDDMLDELLAGVSRLIDRECGRFFNQDAEAVVRHYDGNGQARLYIDDVATATDLVVKVDLDGDHEFDGADETLTVGTHFWLGPANAALGSEAGPYRYLELVPNNGRLSVWPERPRAAQVTAIFGWPAVPGAIVEATVMIAREIADLEQAGMTAALQNIDTAVNLSPTAFSIVQRIKREYGLAWLFV
jgi:hypothetical protein